MNIAVVVEFTTSKFEPTVSNVAICDGLLRWIHTGYKMEYHKRTFLNHDLEFKVWSERKSRGKPISRRIDYPEHPLVGCILWNSVHRKFVLVERVWADWNAFEWQVCLMFHDVENSSGIQFIGVLHKGVEIHSNYPEWIEFHTRENIERFRSTFYVIDRVIDIRSASVLNGYVHHDQLRMIPIREYYT